MRFLVCTVDIDPCPAANVASIAFADALDLASMGINAADVFYVFGWGFAVILFAWKAGYGVQLAKEVISKL
jgi:hypothetical protein